MEIIKKKIEEVIPYENNPRINDGAVDHVANSISEFGFKVPIVIDQNNVIVTGHTRLKAAKKLGLKEVPCILADDLTPAQIKAFRIADNKTNEYAEWDFGKLTKEINDLNLSGYEYDFDFNDVLFKEDKKGNTDPDKIPEPPEIPTTEIGDIWELGDHRLLCGDTRNKYDVKKLMDGNLADITITDPPYNVDYEGGTDKKLKIQNDHMDNYNFYKFLKLAFSGFYEHMKSGACIYVFHADAQGENFRKALVNSGFYFKQCLIWVKNSAPLSRQDYNWKHEPILYGWKPGAAHYFVGDFTKTTVIDDDIKVNRLNKKELIDYINTLKQNIKETILRCDRPTKNIKHPTMKPVSLISEFIHNSSKSENDIVLDLFSGSGTAFIAADKTYRRCYGMESDPKYCDVIIKRWEDFTGNKANLIRR